MNVLEVNIATLGNLYEQFPESFKGLGLDGNKLTYNNESVDISDFNINDLLTGNQNFVASLSVLSSEDIFKIIRLHSLKLNSKLENKKAEGNENNIELIQEENLLMRNVNIVTKNDNGLKKEYFNIVDSSGRDHLFYNDRNIDLFDVYETLKYANPGRDVTPDELIAEMMRKLFEVKLNNASYIVESSSVSEDFRNKMNLVNGPYKEDKSIKVLGNEEHDIAIVADISDPTKHRIVTFNRNEYGDLMLETHNQNVVGTNTKAVNGDSTEIQTDVGMNDLNEDENEVLERNEEEKIATLISEERFYELISSSEELSQEDKESVDYFYSYIGDLITYEDYLLPELKEILDRFRLFVYQLQYEDRPTGLTEREQEAIDKHQELENKNLENSNAYKNEKIEEKVKTLEYVRKNSNSGIVGIIQVIAFIIGIAIILTAATLYLIS